ncbi:MAG: UPF0158 family protein [Leptolyngbyaceae cyanobacterium]
MVKLSEVAEMMDMGNDFMHPYLNRQTGEIIMIGDEDISAFEEEKDLSNYPDWQKETIQEAAKVLTSEDYLQLPTQFEIHEYSIMERFCQSLDEPLSFNLLELLRGSGAFRRFKDAIQRYEVADAWYRYKQAALERIAADWLDAEGIAYEGTVASIQNAHEEEQNSADV